jgi:hypothetical protein
VLQLPIFIDANRYKIVKTTFRTLGDKMLGMRFKKETKYIGTSGGFPLVFLLHWTCGNDGKVSNSNNLY